MQRVVHRKGEERILLLERLFEHVQEPAVGLANRVLRDLGRFSIWERSRLPRLANLALASVRPTALDHELAEDLVSCQDLLCLRDLFRHVWEVVTHSRPQRLLHVIEVRAKVVHTERTPEVLLVATRKELSHVAEVAQSVVDRRRREHEQSLWPHGVVEQVVQPEVARRLRAIFWVTTASGIAEMMRLVDHYHIGELGNPTEALREIALPTQVRVAKDGEITEISIPPDTTDV